MKEMPRPGPPRLAESILRRLREYNSRYNIFRDLGEVHASLFLEYGRTRADVWYWRQCVGAVIKYGVYAFKWKTTMFKNNLKLTWRNIHRNKIHSLLNISGLAVGLTCAILLLLWVQHELSYDLFHKNSADLHLLAWERLANNRHYSSTPYPLGDRLRSDFPEIVDNVRIADHMKRVVRFEDKVFAEKDMMAADPSVFRMFSISLIQGDPDTVLSEPQTIVITEASAKKYFGETNPLGRILEVDGKPLMINGVAQNTPDNSEISFNFITCFQDLPYIREEEDRQSWNFFAFKTFVLVRAEADIPQLNQKLTEAMARYRSWDSYEKNFYLFPLTKIHLHDLGGGGSIKYVYLFSFAAFFVLLISCINFINLSTARSLHRSREVGIRKVLGSDRKLLVRQFFSESLLFVILSFFLAVVLISLCLPAFNSIVQKNLRILGMNIPFFLGIGCILLFTVLLAGSYPSLYLSAFPPTKVLRSQGGKGGRRSLREILVVTQFAISIFLIFCTLIVMRQVHYMKNADLGFTAENLVSIPLSTAMSRQARAMKTKLQQHPDILGITAHGNFNHGGTLKWEGMDPELSYLENEVWYKRVDYDYFETLGAEVIEGRSFLREIRSDYQAGYIINQEAVKLWQLESPIGQALHLIGVDGVIIGVVKNIHEGYKESLHAEVYYLPARTSWDSNLILDIRIRSGGNLEVMNSLKSIWQEFDQDMPFEYYFQDAEIDKKYRRDEQARKIFGYFALLAIFTSCLGLFGLASYMAEQRTKEIGIRKILGASSLQLVMLLNKDFLKSVIFANLLAWPVGWIIMRSWLQAYPYRTRLGIEFFLLASALAVVIAFITVSLQAIRAAVSNPVNSLRYE
jgi:putative ABC transport system permease protein